jgi:thiol-disulfide isomerase/thioredoxin
MKLFFLSLLMVLLIFIVGCSPELMDSAEMEEKAELVEEQIESELLEIDACPDWKCENLTDVISGEEFNIEEFAGQTILLESFAVWCPTCLKQQREMGKIEGVIHISIDTDPNEDEILVKDHAIENDLNWYFAVSPVEVTKALIEDFGIGVVNAPSAPVVLICPDQSARLLDRGFKNVEELNEAISSC